MARDLNTLGDIRYIHGPTGVILAQGLRQINQGQKPDCLDIELRSDAQDEETSVKAEIPFDAYFEALRELAQEYPATE